MATFFKYNYWGRKHMDTDTNTDTYTDTDAYMEAILNMFVLILRKYKVQKIYEIHI